MALTRSPFWNNYYLVKNDLVKGKNTSYTSVRIRLRKIERFVFSYRGTPIENGAISKITSKKQHMVTQDAYETGEVYLEGSLRNTIIKKMGGNKLTLAEVIELLKKAPPVRRTFKYAGKEVKEAKITKDSSLVHVGTGSLPETLLGIYDSEKNSLPKLTGVDMLPEAIQEAKEVLEVMGLESKVKLICTDGAALSYKKFSHILVAVLVRPEIKTVEQICKTAAKNKKVTVLLRTVSGLGKMIYKPASLKSIRLLTDAGFKQIGLVKGHVVMETMIFVRNPL